MEKASLVMSPNVSARHRRLPLSTSQTATTPHLRTSGCGRGGNVSSDIPEQAVATMVPLGETATHWGSRLGTNGAAEAREWLKARRVIRNRRTWRDIGGLK